jgi:protocatechuate 3,4-dioxygenase beta subunit
MPPRDAQSQPQAGTAVIKGRITAADTGRPLRRARVTARAAELGQRGRDVSTDADGRYEIRDLPAGRYSLTVSRSSYLRLSYGQRRPLEQGKQLDVSNGQLLDNIHFALPKMSVIAGRVTDELGDPIEGANVFAMRMDYWQGRRRVVPASQVAQTDDVGQYRITGLMPGTYWVMATIRETWTVTEGAVMTGPSRSRISSGLRGSR